MSYYGRGVQGLNNPTLGRGAVHIQQFTGNGTETTFGLLVSPASQNHTCVYVNGVYQNKTSYTVSGSSLIFSVAPTNGHIIEIEITDTLESITWRTGIGSPEGIISAPIGSLYTNLSGGTNTTLYVKVSGTDSTGWVAK
jgi:hypothetical protein